MFEWIFTNWRLSKLFREKDKIRAKYLEDIKGKSAEVRQSISSEASYEDSFAEDEIDSVITSHLIKRAQRLFIPIPNRQSEEMWRELVFDSGRVLTAHGITALRTAIGAESRERRDYLIVILSTLTGIIGALTGLAAIFSK